MATCEHMTDEPVLEPGTQGCEECLEIGQRWVHLRLCRVCGHVGCCDSSIGKHATAHFHQTRHATMQSFEPGEDWGWCYVDSQMLGPFEPLR
ncbi:MAG: UBP-type zinc finger domain-containing protein [Deltaproteobacteria bacterium]|nr:UBP-type zinc finger domain-containing protein [Deltaproteobacteria bacterium]